jgi:hypothetical protein
MSRYSQNLSSFPSSFRPLFLLPFLGVLYSGLPVQMRFSLLICAYVATEIVSAVPTITTTASSPTVGSCVTRTSTATSQSSCRADDCARALRNPIYRWSASNFCRTYTASCNNDLAAVPTYLENCGASPVAVSSGCSCLVPAPTPTSYSQPPFDAEKCGTTGPASGSSKQNFLVECGQSYDKTLATSTTTAASSG